MGLSSPSLDFNFSGLALDTTHENYSSLSASSLNSSEAVLYFKPSQPFEKYDISKEFQGASTSINLDELEQSPAAPLIEAFLEPWLTSLSNVRTSSLSRESSRPGSSPTAPRSTEEDHAETSRAPLSSVADVAASLKEFARGRPVAIQELLDALNAPRLLVPYLDLDLPGMTFSDFTHLGASLLILVAPVSDVCVTFSLALGRATRKIYPGLYLSQTVVCDYVWFHLLRLPFCFPSHFRLMRSCHFVVETILEYNELDADDPQILSLQLDPVVAPEIRELSVFVDRYDTEKGVVCLLIWSNIDEALVCLPSLGLQPFPLCWKCNSQFGLSPCTKCGVAKYCSVSCMVRFADFLIGFVSRDAHWLTIFPAQHDQERIHRKACPDMSNFVRRHQLLVFERPYLAPRELNHN
jgi:hypothetical protein